MFLFINRQGIHEDSFMITNNCIDTYDINQHLLFTENKLIKIEKREKKEDKENNEENKRDKEKMSIQYTILPGKQVITKDDPNNNNILGKNDLFIIDKEIIEILVEEIDKISFYGAQLLNEGDQFCLQNKQIMNLFEMEIGKKYVDSFLLQNDYGDGFYIETHDLPHLHQPLDAESGGHIILGKMINGEICLSAFKIPFRKTLFIPPNVYHSDAYLVGKYNVVYDKTDNFSTMLFKNIKREIIKVYIKSN
jgi:hypothetical protein